MIILDWENKTVLMFVKTYPTPSRTHHETVCTAGVTEDGKWIRLYPIRFRYLDYSQRFKKYTWINADVMRNSKDNRPESYKIKEDNIKIIRELSSTGKDLEERKRFILPLCSPSLEYILKEESTSKRSLGIFRPKEVLDFVVEKDVDRWTPKQEAILSQTSLFDKSHKPLEKIPWKFSFAFTCDDKECIKPHKYKITDWEIYQAFRNFREYYSSENEALEKLKEKYMNYFTYGKESYLIVGNTYPYRTFIVLGIFSYANKNPEQLSLF